MFVSFLDELNELDHRGLAVAFRELDQQRRTIEAQLAGLVNFAARHSVHRIDCHASIRGWMKAQSNCSDAEASNLVRLGQLIHEIPDAGTLLHDGQIGIAQASELAKARRNPRCGEQLADIAPTLLEHAATLPFADFRLCVQRWKLLADPDGAYKDRAHNHEIRDASVHESEAGLHLRADGGTAAAANEMIEIFERFRTAEFLTDWDDAVASHGPNPATAQMHRTDAQRRFDALAAIFRAAASAPLDARALEPTVNIVVDQETFEAHLAQLMTDPDDVARSSPTVVTSDPYKRRCETTNGTLLHPDDVLTASLIGHVRRVVYDSAGTVIDLGRRRRLFTGSARDAVMLQAQRCLWPGCDLPASRCEADHLKPWSADGTTTPANGSPACPRHNRAKNRGFTARRNAQGRWHVYRPDGSELTEPPLSDQAVRGAAPASPDETSWAA